MNRHLMADLKTWRARKDRKPLILRGARQVGKTWLLKYFGEQEFPNFHYVNFEEDERLNRLFQVDLRPGRLLDELRFYLDHPIDPVTDLVIFAWLSDLDITFITALPGEVDETQTPYAQEDSVPPVQYNTICGPQTLWLPLIMRGP